MEITAEQFSAPVQKEVERATKGLQGRGVIFGEALQEGAHTLIPVMKSMSRGGKVIFTRPVAVIVISGDKVSVKRFQSRGLETMLILFGITSLLGTIPVVFFPPWRPGESLLAEVGRFWKTIREG